MLAEEVFKIEMRWLLNEIQKVRLRSTNQELINIDINEFSRIVKGSAIKSMPTEVTQQLLYKLESLGAINFVEPPNYYGRLYNIKYKSYLRIKPKKFDELYKQYVDNSSREVKQTTPNKQKLNFFPDDGLGEFKGEEATFKLGNKDFVLLDHLQKNKNTPQNEEDIKRSCNNKIKNQKHIFKGAKDIDDTIARVKKKLKVSKTAYFPISKTTETSWLWKEN